MGKFVCLDDQFMGSARMVLYALTINSIIHGLRKDGVAVVVVEDQEVVVAAAGRNEKTTS